MTNAQAVKEIRQLGMRAASSEDEIIVKCCTKETHWYYTDDPEDAVTTARAMLTNTCMGNYKFQSKRHQLEG